jgi:hypothetical protein
MVDCSSQLALRTDDQLESAGKPEQDRYQRPQLHPVQQQANRFKTHFALPWSWVFARHSPLINVPT